VIGALTFWAGRRSGEKARKLAASTEFEINGDLTSRSSISSITITKDEVTELRYLKDGIVVRGKDLQQTVFLKAELGGFKDVVRSIEEWTPARVPRVRSWASISVWLVPLVVANLGLFVIAMSSESQLIAIPLSIAEASILVSAIIWVWRTNGLGRWLKWQMLIGVVPAISLLVRAWLLWTQP
jgi:uncharacterized membrane protein YdbT with pleckstrin-like domain